MCFPSLLSRVDFYDQTIVGIVLLVSLQVLKTLPAFVIVLIVKICCVTGPKLVFWGMYDELKLKRNKMGFPSQFLLVPKNNKLFFLREHPPPKKKTTPDNLLRKWPKRYHTPPSPMTDFGH
jgi:hypothetical protein